MKIIARDISERNEFNRCGIHYTQVYADDTNHIYLYKMNNRDYSYELVQGKRHKNPDGTVVYTYPGDEDFGTYGWYISGPKEYTERRIAEKIHSLTGSKPKTGV